MTRRERTAAGAPRQKPDTTERINRLYTAYVEEYRAAAEAAGRNPDELGIAGPFQLLQVAGETFAQDHLGRFHPAGGGGDGKGETPIVSTVSLEAGKLSGRGLQFSPDLLRIEGEEELRGTLRKIAEQNLAAELAERACPRAVAGYESMQPYLDRFFKDHPDYEKNVFVMMRFRQDEHYLHLFEAMDAVLKRHGLLAVRADQKSYPPDDDLWANIVIYMLGCRYGIAVFEDFDEREFNANVALEYGFMRALNKRVLILKEQRMPQVPTDVTANRFKVFDMMRIDETVPDQIESWLRDIELS